MVQGGPGPWLSAKVERTSRSKGSRNTFLVIMGDQLEI